jgi:two-component system, OmpR family, phosphate regulon sensor histidine kinase PhoR
VRARVFFKLTGIFLLLIAITTLSLDFAVRRAWRRSLVEELETSLSQKATMVAAMLPARDGCGFDAAHAATLDRIIRPQAQASQARITVIDRCGNVLADSEADARTMENHASRPEFAAALEQHTMGRSSRLSATVHTEFLYTAVPLHTGAVRLAYPLTTVRERLTAVRQGLVAASTVAFLISAIIAAAFAQWMSNRLGRIITFADRIASGDYSARIAETWRDELSHVSRALDESARKLEESFAQVKTSRQELEALLNSMQEPVLAVTAERRVQWANGEMGDLVDGGIKIGAPLVQIVRDPELLNIIARSIAQREVASARLELIKPGRTFQATSAPIPGGGAVAVLYEITAIEKVEKTRRDFIANVSHELRTPLTSVRGYAESLLDMNLDAQAREFLEIIRKNALRMTQLTEDLLVLARVESGEDELKPKPVLPSVILQSAKDTLDEFATLRGQSLRIEDHASTTVMCDLDKIQHVFSNLVENALKYAPHAKEVVIGAEDVDHGVEFFVRDSGPGIPSEHLPRLFERFYRVDKARSQETGGTGLGLAIVKHIVLKHGGNVRAESELKKGSTFYFKLPAA